MKRSLLLCLIMTLFVAACAPAATPAAAPQAPAAQPTSAPPPTSAPAQPAPAWPTQAYIPTSVPGAPRPTLPPLATGMPELKPPLSGGVLNPPTLVPTAVNSSVTSGQTAWNTFREPTLGLSFQYPPDWQTAINRNNRSTVATISITRTASTSMSSATIVIDVRRKQGDLLTWLSRQLPIGLLLLDGKALEGGANSYRVFNARLAGNPAVFLYAPAHAAVADAAALHTADEQYFYQFTYLGSRPDNVENRVVFLRLLSTTSLSGTLSAGVLLSQTAFTTGVDLTQIK